jgi:uncharacterized membrane protein YidH (DUF202 family)
MSRGAGTGLIGFGIVLAVIGAILDFAVSTDTSGFNINTIGLILLIAGVVMTVLGIAVFAMGSNRRSVMREDVRAVPGGSERYVERRDDLAS